MSNNNIFKVILNNLLQQVRTLVDLQSSGLGPPGGLCDPGLVHHHHHLPHQHMSPPHDASHRRDRRDDESSEPENF